MSPAKKDKKWLNFSYSKKEKLPNYMLELYWFLHFCFLTRLNLVHDHSLQGFGVRYSPSRGQNSKILLTTNKEFLEP